MLMMLLKRNLFQSTLPCGSDRFVKRLCFSVITFQSTLPCGSDGLLLAVFCSSWYFNPRSLAGATLILVIFLLIYHYFNPRSLAGATCNRLAAKEKILFQSTLPCGSDKGLLLTSGLGAISIHAPLRERLGHICRVTHINLFQSTLPCGSDLAKEQFKLQQIKFQSTLPCGSDDDEHIRWSSVTGISIHAPLRERPLLMCLSLAIMWNFNPRSLAGATLQSRLRLLKALFQSTLPCGSDSIKRKYFSFHLNQAFFANQLNSNTQEFYFDVRKLLVSHSSSSCEPKLKFMFHITSHRINLDYFSSCQSICK